MRHAIVFGMAIIVMIWGKTALCASGPDHRVSNSVVQIRGVTPEKRSYFGSGVVVAPKVVATNCHVIRQGGTIGIFRGYRSYEVSGIRADETGDLCLLEIPELDFKPAHLAGNKSLRRGARLSYYGFPRALGMTYSSGLLLGTRKVDGVPLIETSAFFTLGGSGGGLFDEKGRLVGLATFITPGHGGGYFAVGIDQLTSVMKRPIMPVRPLTGKAFWEAMTYALPRSSKGE